MKIAVLSESGYGAWFATLFHTAGHEVTYVCKAPYRAVLSGIAPMPVDLPSLGSQDLVVFDMDGNGRFAERVRQQAPVIGDSQFAEDLEEDRAFGIEMMQKAGIAVPKWFKFSTLREAIAIVQAEHLRFVFKPDGGDADCADTYVARDSADMLAYISGCGLKQATAGILQEFIEGIEVSVEGHFDGNEWRFINVTFEEKKLMAGGLGPNTGCAGNLVRSFAPGVVPKVFSEGIGRMEAILRLKDYRGMIDLNSVVSIADNKLYGLEFTPRFGYDATPTQTVLINGDFGTFLWSVATRRPGPQPVAGYAASVRLSIPPYPWQPHGKGKGKIFESGIPIGGIKAPDLKRCYLYDAMLDASGNLVTSGHEGFVAAPFCRGDTIQDAFEGLSEQVKRIRIPDMQYRNDIERATSNRHDRLDVAGWLSPGRIAAKETAA